jgi:flagellar hook assembly protein FlgD
VPLTTTGISPWIQADAFALHPVSPNPFYSSASVRFELRSRLKTQLEIYDSTGKMIAKPVNEEKESGNFSILWDGKNSTGVPVPEGMYYFRMTGGNIIRIQKALRAKQG